MEPIFIVLIIFGVILFFFFVCYLLGVLLLKTSFKREDLPEKSFYLNYDEFKDRYPRKEFSFKSKKNNLAGYIYGCENDNTIVYVHGMCPGHTGYLSDIIYLVDKGYKVITYDYTATGKSEGKYFNGLAQQKYDLTSLFNYLKNNDEYKNLSFDLYGHSMGGYAVGVCINKYENIKRVVSISGFDTPHSFLYHVSSVKFGKFKAMVIYFPIFVACLFKLGFSFNEKASKNINNSNKDIFIIHGNEDETVSLKDSIYKKIEKSNHKNIKSLLITDPIHNGHNSIIASTDCVKYQQKQMDYYKEQLDKTKDNKKAYTLFLENTDAHKFNVANDKLMDIIIKFYRNGINE